MNEKHKNATVSTHKEMSLAIVEVRGSWTCHEPQDGYWKVESATETKYAWQLRGSAAKLDPEAEGFERKQQEIYEVMISSQSYSWPAMTLGFETKAKAICNALDFAARNGLEVDGYAPLSREDD